MSFKVLESVLRPLSYWYNQDNIEEVAVNRSGQIWLRLRGKRAYPWVMYKDEKLSKEYLVDLLYIVANTYELPFDPVEGSPVVYATIPGEHRFSAIVPNRPMKWTMPKSSTWSFVLRLTPLSAAKFPPVTPAPSGN